VPLLFAGAVIKSKGLESALRIEDKVEKARFRQRLPLAACTACRACASLPAGHPSRYATL